MHDYNYMEWLEFIIAILHVIPVYILLLFCLFKWNKYESLLNHSFLCMLSRDGNDQYSVDNDVKPMRSFAPSELNKQQKKANNDIIHYNYNLLMNSVRYYENLAGCVMETPPRFISDRLKINKNKILQAYKEILVRKDILSRIFYRIIIYDQ